MPPQAAPQTSQLRQVRSSLRHTRKTSTIPRIPTAQQATQRPGRPIRRRRTRPSCHRSRKPKPSLLTQPNNSLRKEVNHKVMPEPRKRRLDHKLPQPLAMALYRPSVKAALLLNPSSRRTHLHHRRPVKWRSFLHPPKPQLQLQPPLQHLLSTPAKRRRPQRSRPVPLRSPRNPPQRNLGNARPLRLAEKAKRRPEQKPTDQPKSGESLEKRPPPLVRMKMRRRTRPKVVGPCAQGQGGRER